MSGLALRLAFGLALVWPALGMIGAPKGLAIAPVDEAILFPACLLAFAGAAFALYAQAYMGGSWRVGTVAGQLGPLVVTGPFAISRNPVFVGQILLLTGLGACFPSITELAAAAIAVAAIIFQAHREEAALRLQHRASYLDYARRTPRWLGLRSAFGRRGCD